VLAADRASHLSVRGAVARWESFAVSLATRGATEGELGSAAGQSVNRTCSSPHLATFGTGPDGLLFTNERGRPLRRSAFGTTWRAAVAAAGPPGVTFHSLRHYYASLLIRPGESVKTVQDRLGHASAVETLDTYSHLWPDSDDRTREAVDAVLGATEASAPDTPADSPRTP